MSEWVSSAPMDRKRTGRERGAKEENRRSRLIGRARPAERDVGTSVELGGSAPPAPTSIGRSTAASDPHPPLNSAASTCADDDAELAVNIPATGRRCRSAGRPTR